MWQKKKRKAAETQWSFSWRPWSQSSAALSSSFAFLSYFLLTVFPHLSRTFLVNKNSPEFSHAEQYIVSIHCVWLADDLVVNLRFVPKVDGLYFWTTVCFSQYCWTFITQFWSSGQIKHFQHFQGTKPGAASAADDQPDWSLKADQLLFILHVVKCFEACVTTLLMLMSIKGAFCSIWPTFTMYLPANV